MSEPRLQQFLHEHAIGFETIHHARSDGAQETAHHAHVPQREMAKTVLVKIDGRMAMTVLSADHRLDLAALRQATGAHRAELAHEDEFTPLFPDCETGAMPPFGNLYGMDVFVDGDLPDDGDIVFNAGSHTELIRIPFALFEQLVHPRRLRRIHQLSSPMH